MHDQPQDEKKYIFSDEAMGNIRQLLQVLKDIRARLAREGIDINDYEKYMTKPKKPIKPTLHS